ncbi:MAG TPA: response regulator transcription factor [Vicinamibacterales bacterium]|jgi:DNA-binding NarL/FixJ family response regulator|nr:response regulator transcription factor [Vicinamibacterales bacterium]
MPKISVLLADDHALVRRGFRRILEDDDAIAVVAEASNGNEAVALATSLKPRVIVMDCAMPQKSGLDAMREILQALPKTAVLMLSMHSEETLVRQALAAGAKGYVLKSALDLDLAAAVKRVAQGETVLDPNAKPLAPKDGERQALTPRELQVLRLICAGQSNREIAVELDVSVNTIAVHRANIMSALGIHKTAELVVYAIHNGLVQLG